MKHQLITGIALISFANILFADSSQQQISKENLLTQLKNNGSLIEVKSETDNPPTMCGRMCFKTDSTQK